MNKKWLSFVLIPVVLGVLLASPFIFNFLNPIPPPTDETGASLSSFMESKSSDVLAVQILGNSTDIVYPELMAALFIANSTGTWIVSATFLNDSQGPGNILYYEEYFETTIAEVESINNAMYAGLAATSLSLDSISDLYYPLGFGLDILYTDGTWVQLFTIQSPKGHIIFLNGTYTGTPDTVNPFDSAFIQRDQSWQNGILLEPGYALNGLVITINGVFVNHLG
ncbi:MAG: hypothetical protein ACFE89_09770 [Candidatus Hodarchaeota archaeon]